ncbi:hypothetical protein PHMEG_0009208 [Phytophthora megakarya]|uniref:PiggyBac transposable element-derived protein domain-containing protein n=1 Tax=Phytophthora megakarya TaxID=4795 RepID=A0A225WII7_9STRA|nr:hypothetical protein PHMEG_0009208 [Phytophthora megakarya]
MGYPKEVTTEHATRPPDIPRGSTKMAGLKRAPQITDLLAPPTRGKKVVAPCPSMMRDYHRWMGRVDIHDQLRLQRYSLQLAVAFKKYYKTICLGLVDMAIMNAYIVFREARKQRNESPADHALFQCHLQAQMLG